MAQSTIWSKVISDVFQEWLNAVLKDIKKIIGSVDDILAKGVNSKDHDVNLLRLLEIARINRIKLNPKKLPLKTLSVNSLDKL